MPKPLIKQTWYLLGDPWCHSDDAGVDIYAGDPDPHIGTHIINTQDVFEEQYTKEQAQEIAQHIVDLHNAAIRDLTK